MKKILLLLLALAPLLAVPRPVAAQETEYSILDVQHRTSFAIGANRRWYIDDEAHDPAVPMSEWTAGGYLGYSLLALKNADGTTTGRPSLTLVGSMEWPLETKKLEGRLGLRLNLYRGGK